MSLPSPRFSIDTSAASSSPTSPQSSRTSYPFPDRTASFNRYYPSRRGSNASSFSTNTHTQSVGGSLDINVKRRGSTSSVREISQNAISTILQPPIVRTGLLPHTQATAQASGYKAPTVRDIPPVSLSKIPHVPPQSFQEYLQKIGPLFDQLQRGRIEPEVQQKSRKEIDGEKSTENLETLSRRENTAASPTISRQHSSATLSPVEAPTPFKRRYSGQLRRSRNEPTPLSTIPFVYFDEDFHLENPRTFDIVSERAEIVRPVPGEQLQQEGANGAALPPRKALATNAILQEKLSWYMDTVEVHLVSSISTASSGFFAALGSLNELQEEAEQSIEKIQQLRQDLKRLDEEVAVGGLEVAAKRRRQENVKRLGRAAKQVQRVVEEVKMADESVDERNYDKAADLLEKIGRIVCGERDSGEPDSDEWIDLRSLQALQGLEAGMKELQYRIGAGFSAHFSACLLSDLQQHLETVPASDTLKRWSRQRGVPPKYIETSDQLRKDLETSLKSLSRAGHSTLATTAFREAALKEIKSMIRKHLPSSSDDDAESMVSTSTRGGHKLSQQEKSSILARNLRALDAEDAERMLIDIYVGVGEALRRLSTQTKVLLDVSSRLEINKQGRSPVEGRSSSDELSSRGEKGPKIHIQDELTQALDISSLLTHAVDTSQSQITRILKVRNEQTIRMPKSRFMRYFLLNRLFADECEAVSGQGGQALKGVINAQISGFVQVSGQSETERVAQLLDHDTWEAKDFTSDDETILQRILGAMSSDPNEWTIATPIWEELSSPLQQNGEKHINGTSTSVANGATDTKKAAAKPAFIDETRFVLVASAIQLLPTIDQSLSMTASIPSMTPQISTALLDVLKMFNSRSCQLILGAGATRSAGLKNITTKHLALASQALSFVIALVPYVRECARRHLPSGQNTVLADFDKTKRLYQDHQSGIHDKLVEIMTSRSTAHIKSFTNLNFDSPAAGGLDAEKASPYMETLTKETLTLHRVLSRHLTEFDVSMIMRRIFEAYRDQWVKAFSEKDVDSSEGEKRMTRDAEVMEARLGKVKEFEVFGKDIIAVIKARSGGADGRNTAPKNKTGKVSLEIATGVTAQGEKAAK
ncbi:Vps54-domain-containing protein [Polychaeton citri CBS 116435]|uniref:Vacuolar protein sorting-associated protein 54 n=1 Tax=Polychaeton citri CBS 116435 TaxID=1314669 RepID=A0A9P4QHU0_9PEZI|nr:Vps54-domain-containing protein [Polychaeton citri CBS 116435]